MSDDDSPWKEALDRHFPLVLAFFFPEIFEAIDWSRDYEALDTELQKLAPEGDVGRRRVDKLIKVYRKDTGAPVYLHIEVQSQEEEGFERRLRPALLDDPNDVGVVELGGDAELPARSASAGWGPVPSPRASP
jgi:hypothetical protein